MSENIFQTGMDIDQTFFDYAGPKSCMMEGQSCQLVVAVTWTILIIF